MRQTLKIPIIGFAAHRVDQNIICEEEEREGEADMIFGAATKVIPAKHLLTLVITRWGKTEFRGRLPFFLHSVVDYLSLVTVYP